MDGRTYTQGNEGLRLHAYPDPLTHAEPYTIGYGHTGPDVDANTTWDMAQVEDAFEEDWQKATDTVQALWVDINSEYLPCVPMSPRDAALWDLAYDIGETRLRLFVNFNRLVRSRMWNEAAHDLMTTAYAKELPARASSNAYMLKNDAWLPT